MKLRGAGGKSLVITVEYQAVLAIWLCLRRRQMHCLATNGRYRSGKSLETSGVLLGHCALWQLMGFSYVHAGCDFRCLHSPSVPR